MLLAVTSPTIMIESDLISLNPEPKTTARTEKNLIINFEMTSTTGAASNLYDYREGLRRFAASLLVLSALLLLQNGALE